MIVPMKRVTLLCMARHRDETLARLRDLGVLHLAAVRPPEGDDLARLKAGIERTRRALDILETHGPAGGAGPTGGAEGLVDETLDAARRLKDLAERVETLRREVDALVPWGDFDVEDVRRLAGHGVTVRLYHAGVRERIEHSDNGRLLVIQADASGRYVALAGMGELRCSAREVPLPERSPGAARREWQAAREALDEGRRRLADLSRSRGAVAALLEQFEEDLALAEARAGMGAQEAVAYLAGFCPADALERLRREAAVAGWGLLVTDPAPDDDTVPTLIRNPAWVQPIKAVLDLIGILPGYREIDINACFLLFLSLFFGMLVGDAGYGLLFLGLTAWARRKFPAAPAYLFVLLRIMSVAALVWGTLTGTYFAVAHAPAPLARLKVEWLADERNVMRLCFLVGAVHLTVAHLWNAARNRDKPVALAQLGWIGMTWTMYFLACTLVLGHTFPPVLRLVAGISVALIAVFMTPLSALKSEWFNHAMLPLTLVSSFIDLVSYIRLYAVGAAGVAVASAFNDMAFSQVHSVLTGFAAALILFFGHALNIVLDAMAVLVHGVRLNVLEFSSHIGMQWAGVPYAPFARARAGVPAEKR